MLVLSKTARETLARYAHARKYTSDDLFTGIYGIAYGCLWNFHFPPRRSPKSSPASGSFDVAVHPGQRHRWNRLSSSYSTAFECVYPSVSYSRTVTHNHRLLGSPLPDGTNTAPQPTGTVCHSPRYLSIISLLIFFSADIQNSNGTTGGGSTLGSALELIRLGSLTFLVSWILAVAV